LVEAARLFAVKGYHGTSTREIAAAVGIRQPSLFHHFESKEAIMSALYDYDLSTAVQTAALEATKPGPPEIRLYAYLLDDVQWLLCSPYDLGGLHRMHVLREPAFAKWRDKLDELRRYRLQMIREAIDSGAFIDIAPEFAHEAITAMIVGVIQSHDPDAKKNPERHARELAGLALRALLKDPSDLAKIRRLAAEREVLAGG